MAQAALEERTETASAAPAFADPGPLGLSGFALATFVLSAQAAGLFKAPHVVIGLALFYGGLMQVIAGVQAFRAGNTFAATAFCSYAGFWLSFAAIFIPGTGILDAYFGAKGTGALDFNTAVGFYMLGWTIFTAYVFLASLKTNMALIVAFFLALVTFLLFAIGYLLAGSGGDPSLWLKLGGYAGILLALSAWYAAAAFLLGGMGSSIKLPVGAR